MIHSSQTQANLQGARGFHRGCSWRQVQILQPLWWCDEYLEIISGTVLSLIDLKGYWIENDDVNAMFARFKDELVILIATVEIGGSNRVLNPLRALVKVVVVDVKKVETHT